MENLKKSLTNGIKEGWTLFWSPLTGFYAASKQVVFAKEPAPGMANNFKAGLREGWSLYWSPLTSFIKAAKFIIKSK